MIKIVPFCNFAAIPVLRDGGGVAICNQVPRLASEAGAEEELLSVLARHHLRARGLRNASHQRGKSRPYAPCKYANQCRLDLISSFQNNFVSYFCLPKISFISAIFRDVFCVELN
jgi:hypothetical protein